jgi:hypothetical protein
MIYHQNKPAKVIAVDQSLIGIVPLDRPLSVCVWVKPSELTADEGLVEILDKAREIEEWQIEHNTVLAQAPLVIKRRHERR